MSIEDYEAGSELEPDIKQLTDDGIATLLRAATLARQRGSQQARAFNRFLQFQLGHIHGATVSILPPTSPNSVMDPELDALDFEKDYLADVLRMTGDHIGKLERHINPNDPEGNAIIFDPMEHIAGVAVVTAQRYIASVCNWFSVPRTQALMLGPQKKKVPVAKVIDAAANYWKHIEDGPNAVYADTREVLANVGVAFESGYCVSNTIHECGYKHLSELLPDLIAWRDDVLREAQMRNPDRDYS